MISLDFPILFVGPAGSGKLTRARAALGVSATQEPILKFLVIGDYSARYWEFLTHIEVDVSDLSMMDKQIIPEIINQLLSSRNVRAGSRKLMILRRVHCLSPAAATRLRVCLENIVWTHEIPAIIWCTARTVNSAVASILDGFIYKRIPGPIPQMIQTELIQKFDNSSKIAPLKGKQQWIEILTHKSTFKRLLDEALGVVLTAMVSAFSVIFVIGKILNVW